MNNESKSYYFEINLDPSKSNSDGNRSNSIESNSKIVEDWEGGYKLELDLKAKSDTNNWQVDARLPYDISASYGVDVVDKGNGNYTISGQDSWANLKEGQSIKPIIIVEDKGKEALVPEFDSNLNNSTSTPDQVSAPKPETLDTSTNIAENLSKDQTEKLDFISQEGEKVSSIESIESNSKIVEDWNGGYKLELDLKAKSDTNNWQVDARLPYDISASYGVDVVDKGNGNYTISGQNDQVNLKQGQSIQPIFIIDDSGKEALTLKFDSNSDSTSDSDPTSNSDSTTDSDLETSDTSIDNIANEGKSVGQKGEFSYGEALQKNFLFLEANRSGDLGADNRIEWRSDSTMNDGSTVGRDLEGGYFDAGDHVKFGQPMAASVSMLAWGGVEYTDAYKRSGQLDELLEAVKWGTDYFLKAHETKDGKTSKLWVQVGEGGVANDHGYWGTPETVEENTTRNAFAIDAANPGSDVAASTASALAASSMLFRGTDDAYADKLIDNAKQLFEFAETYQGKYSDSVDAANPFYTSWSGFADELAEGAAWLYKATGEQSYLDKAEDYFKNQVGGLGDWSWAADDHSYGAAVILAQESKDPYFKDQVEGWLNKWIDGDSNIKYTDGGFAHRAEWGSIPVTSSAAFLAQLYNDTVKKDSRYSDFANKQVNYILGDNPNKISYMIGFGDNYPQHPHHRGSSPNVGGEPTAPAEHTLYGAIVGGPRSADDNSYTDRRDDAITNEVGTSYNAPFASALIQQYDNLGGDPLSESQLDRLIGVDANGVGF